jgi:pimeloyl-ACP methyl ester carboxylesterase
VATVQVADQQLYYEEHGTGTPILGIHGSPSAAAFWEGAAATLSGLGRVLIYDRRGYHRSACSPPAERIDLVDQLDDAEALLESAGGSPAVVIGRSTGGLIALGLAIERPRLVKALVLLEPAVFSLHEEAQAFADELREAALGAASTGPADAVRAVLDRALGPDAWRELPAEVRELFAAGGLAMLAEIRGRGLDLSEHPFAPTPTQLAGVEQPALVLSGDASYPAARLVDQRLAAALPHARHHSVAGGHLVDPAHPAVLDFVAEVLERD